MTIDLRAFTLAFDNTGRIHKTGDSIYFGLGVENSGTDFSGGFSCSVYLSNDSLFDDGDYFMAEFSFEGVDGGEDSDLLYAYTSIPTSIPSGEYTFIVQIDSYDEVVETNENNNIWIGLFWPGRPAPFTIEAPSPQKTTEEIFQSEGKAAFLAKLSLAAYYLDLTREEVGDKINNQKDFTEAAYTEIQKSLTLLDEDTVPITPGLFSKYGKTTKFGTSGFENGIFTKKNAAALVGVSSDALFLTFRGTNDNESSPGLFGLGDLNFNTPDEHHWIGKDDHFKLFKELIQGIAEYVKIRNSDADDSNDIDTIYVAGHSLGASMAEAFMSIKWVQKLFAGVDFEAVTFASPGYGTDFGEDPTDERQVDFWLKNDPILAGSPFADNDGDINTIHHNLTVGDEISESGTLHSMKLYSDFMRFFEANNLSLEQFNDLHGINFDRIYANVEVISEEDQLFKIGSEADEIFGTRSVSKRPRKFNSDFDDLILGGASNDTLKGRGGDDYLDGGAHSDTLYGQGDWDFLYGRGGKDFLIGGYGKDKMWGGKGKDTFIFNNVKETNSQEKIKDSDLIMDFDVGRGNDKIKLSSIDAKWGEDGHQEFTFIGTDPFSGSGVEGEFGSGVEGELRFHRGAKNTFISGDTDGDGLANFTIRLVGRHSLQVDDFILQDDDFIL